MKIKYIKEAAHTWLFYTPKVMLNDIRAAAKNIRAAAKNFYIAFEYLASFLIILLMWIFPIPIIFIGAKSLENLERERYEHLCSLLRRLSSLDAETKK
ncbi:hypothetical protein [Snodgrassella alvi]|uniref:Uncharacterized protein n=1 Tax=Snodgrassella alvi TaxID=1196083 RepID=A0A2N9Y0S2_9NEIS|nr:hypothetical protein [Snodgrassella alvi]PIT58369.1 hypothetical protein BHC49_01820 [Snodgrassella alvi]